ncbi:MAG: transcription antitermination factor NusB [Phycisphaerae bacterium]|nr:transcription antitermination factor NusB [Phycisphaerae bacterium]
MAPAAANYRHAAWLVLMHFKAHKQNSAELIDKYASDIQNRSGLVDISLGVIRNLVFIDSLIAQISGRKINRISEKVLNCLRISVYELVFTNQADYAIVNEAVNLANKTGSKKASGFVNAILRNICRAIKNKSADLKISEPAKTLPLGPGIGCEFNIDILPDAKKFRIEYLSCAFSLPLWLVEQFLAQLGYEQTLNICFASNRKPSIYARPNKLKLTAEELCEKFKTEDVDCELVEQFNMVKINKPGNIAELKSFKEGLFTVQDITSSSVVPLLNPQPGWKVLDLCAAPGTKTMQIAELLANTGLIIATDKNSQRLKKIDENIQRLTATSVRLIDYKTFIQKSGDFAPFDAVLADVPCSNTGVLSRRTEVRGRLDEKILKILKKTQSEILNLAASFVKTDGKICYSTCSILKQENSDAIEAFIRQRPEFKLEKEKLILPSAGTYDCDGGYAAVLIKIR